MSQHKVQEEPGDEGGGSWEGTRMSETLVRSVEREPGPRQLWQSVLFLGMTISTGKKHKRSMDGS